MLSGEEGLALYVSNVVISESRAGYSVLRAAFYQLISRYKLIPVLLRSHPPCMLNCACTPRKEEEGKFFKLGTMREMR